jgi:hypothetical protein
LVVFVGGVLFILLSLCPTLTEGIFAARSNDNGKQLDNKRENFLARYPKRNTRKDTADKFSLFKHAAHEDAQVQTSSSAGILASALT